MATQADVRRIVRSLPETHEAKGRFAFGVRNGAKDKGIVWAWNERVTPKKPKVPNLGVIAVRVANESDKQMLLATDEDKFFTEPHYNGYPAVLVRLTAVSRGELEAVLIAAWRCQAPRALVAAFDQKPIKKPRKRR